jgi:hypothetical protein
MKKSKMQQEFESFIPEQHYLCELSLSFDIDVMEYHDCDIQNAWEIWQASREYDKC